MNKVITVVISMIYVLASKMIIITDNVLPRCSSWIMIILMLIIMTILVIMSILIIMPINFLPRCSSCLRKGPRATCTTCSAWTPISSLDHRWLENTTKRQTC